MILINPNAQKSCRQHLFFKHSIKLAAKRGIIITEDKNAITIINIVGLCPI